MARKRTTKVSVFDYPEHLNPFREEEEEERRAAQAALEGRTSRCHLLLGSPCGTLRSSAASDLSPSSSGMSTPVNGTLRRRMKRRAPLPPVLSPPAPVVSTDSPAIIPEPASTLTSPNDPSSSSSEIPQMTITTETINEEKDDRLQTPTDPDVTIDATDTALQVISTTPTLSDEPPDSSSKVNQDEELNERLNNTDKIQDNLIIENNSEPLENHIEKNDEIYCGDHIEQKEEVKEETKDVTQLTSDQNDTEQKIEREKSSSPECNIILTQEDNDKISENINVPYSEEKQTVDNEITTTEDIINVSEEKSEQKIENCTPLSEECLVSEKLTYIDQEVNENSSLMISNGNCKANIDEKSPAASPRLQCTDRFTTQVSHVEIRIADV